MDQNQDKQPENEQLASPPEDIAPAPETNIQPTTPEPAPPVPPAPAPVAPPPRPAEQTETRKPEPRNFLVALLITISFGFYGLHQVYLGRKTQGWIRFALALLAYPLMFILVGFLIFPVLGVWALVDFFVLYLGKRVDADGKPLISTERDNAWAKTIFIIAVVVGALYAAVLVLALILSLATGFLINGIDTSTPSVQDYNFSSNSY